jgi:hypothetical protein
MSTPGASDRVQFLRSGGAVRSARARTGETLRVRP